MLSEALGPKLKCIKDKLQQAKIEVLPFIKKDRDQYADLYKVVEDYVKANNLFISNLYKIAKLDKSDLIDELVNYHYDIYCSRPFEHSNNLINLIYEKLKKHSLISTLVLNTIVKNEEFVILFDTRVMCKILAIQRDRPGGKSLDLMKIIKPVNINGLNYLPAEIEIIDVYNQLYTNENTNLLFEQKLSKQVIGVVGGQLEKITGGKSDACYERKKDELEAIKVAIVKDFLKDRTDVVLLGGLAVELHKNTNICPKYDRIQIITTLTPDQFRKELSDYLNGLGRNYNITMGDELDLLIPKDFRSKRIVFSMSLRTDMGIKEKPFLEYFNSAEFDVIPYFKHNNILIACKYVICKFLFIDLYVSKFIHSLGKLDDKSYAAKQSRNLELINYVNNMQFQIDGTIGVYFDYEISKKELMLGQERYYAPYFPHSYFVKNDKLRDFS